MKVLKTYQSILDEINHNTLFLVFVKSNSCSVCEAVLPKIELLVTKQNTESAVIAIEDIPEFSGQFLVLTAPAILIFEGGKEVFRQARFLQIEKIEKELTKWGAYNNEKNDDSDWECFL
jgi:thiol-disulfide isomerase/thioredoxin